MLTERDLQDLNNAAILIVGIMERHRIHEEDAAERRTQFKLISNEKNDGNIVVFPSKSKIQSLSALETINKMLVELNVTFKAKERTNGLYEIRPTIGGRRISIYGRTAEEIARKYRELLKKPVAKKEQSCGGKLFDWLDEWLNVYKKPNVAKKTFYNMRLYIEKHIKLNFPNKQLSRYTFSELVVCLNKIESTRMRQLIRGYLRDAFTCAVVAGKIKTSPAQNLPPVKHVKKKGKAYALNDVKDMIVSAAEKLPRRLFLYYLFCLFTGTRRDEALYIKLQDCDFKNRILYIRGTKSENAERRFPMFPIVEQIILATGVSKATERLFPFNGPQVDRNFKLFRGEEMDGVLHWLRHTFGTVHICALNIPANTVALWIGHSEASITMDIYTHPEDLAPDVYYSGNYSEAEKIEILKARYNEIISVAQKFL